MFNRKYTYYYFIGIGGIGMSALARYFKSEGAFVAGYDKTPSPLTQSLEQEGMLVSFDDEISAIPEAIVKNPSASLIVYTPAIPSSSKLLHYFRQNYDLLKRSEVLGQITNNSINLAVAGTHGKTTTTCMLAAIFKASSKNFKAFLGGISADLNSNYYSQLGQGELYTLTEADEFDRSFLRLNPTGAIITSTDADHLDVYGSQESIEEGYSEFSKLVKKTSMLFRSHSTLDAMQGSTYSLTESNATYLAEVVEPTSRGTSFRIYKGAEVAMNNLYINIPGKHNVENAMAASLLASSCGISIEIIALALKSFKGIKRRFEVVIETNDFVYIDDYAHHPSELDSIISSVIGLYPNKKITAVFQPHLYSRTRDFVKGFSKSLSKVDELYMMPIYPAREEPIPGVTSEMVLNGINKLDDVRVKQMVIVEKQDLIKTLIDAKPQVLLTLGAGDIDRFVEPIKEAFSI